MEILSLIIAIISLFVGIINLIVAILTVISKISNPSEITKEQYVSNLRKAIAIMVICTIVCIIFFCIFFSKRLPETAPDISNNGKETISDSSQSTPENETTNNTKEASNNYPVTSSSIPSTTPTTTPIPTNTTLSEESKIENDVPETIQSGEDSMENFDSNINNSTTPKQEVFEEQIKVSQIETSSKTINNIEEKLLAIDDGEIREYNGNIMSDEQIDIYTFTPNVTGRYRFEISEMLSGVRVNMVICDQSDTEIYNSKYGIENNMGTTIEDIVSNEKYTIKIKQYSSYSPYKLLIGCQKDNVNINDKVTQITDSVQYTNQKNIYLFTPPTDGSYRFELAEMTSGSLVDMNIFNPGGEEIGREYRITNKQGITIEMVANETYKIAVTQYQSYTKYKLLIGYQKNTVLIDGETEIFDSIQYTQQKNKYQFIPPINGRYTFKVSDLISGVKVNISVLNQSQIWVYGKNGISKGEGIKIDDMVGGETYTIEITQDNSFSPYTLQIGYQKPPIEINKNGVSDAIQYTWQRNIYMFKPVKSGNYLFIIDKMMSGMKVEFSIFNQGEAYIGGRWANSEENEISIEDMVENEVYTIYITQYEGEGSYCLTIESIE